MESASSPSSSLAVRAALLTSFCVVLFFAIGQLAVPLQEGAKESIRASSLPFPSSKPDPTIEDVKDVSSTTDIVQTWMNQLTLKEKCDLLRGSVDTHGYTGFVPGVPRLGIPSLRMNDGPQGFRGPKKTSTAWPCKFFVDSTIILDGTWYQELTIFYYDSDRRASDGYYVLA